MWKVGMVCVWMGALMMAQSGPAKLTLQPSEPLTEPRFPKASKAGDVPAEKPLRPAVLRLQPATDAIYVDEESKSEDGEWRTYRVPKVDGFSKNADGLALQGYDVVSYLERRAERGTKQFTAEYAGATWWFVSAEHRRLFETEPARYVPEFGGFCAYSVARGYPATVDPRVYSTGTGKLYLFFNPAAREVWEQEQRALIAKADKNWPRLHR